MAGGKGAMADAALENDNCRIAVTVLLGPAISMSLRFLLPRATLSRLLLLLSATRMGIAGRGGGGARYIEDTVHATLVRGKRHGEGALWDRPKQRTAYT